MALPKSRNSVPGLQSLIALSKHSRVVRMSFCDSSSILPTGYVSLRSPWNPDIHKRYQCENRTTRSTKQTIKVERYICGVVSLLWETNGREETPDVSPILMISPSCSFLWSGIPWHMISFTELRNTMSKKTYKMKSELRHNDAYARANRLGKVTIVQRWGISFTFDDRIMDDSIDGICRDTRPNGSSRDVEDFSRKLL